jgi:rfaE bifunctional protein nucleotidyltransferase chain/domain
MNSVITAKLIAFEDIDEIVKSIKEKRGTVALSHGVFDLIHPGHLRHLQRARSLADVLVVSITSDFFVNKGAGRPVFTENLRAEFLANILSVDFVVITPFATSIEIIEKIKPDVYVKGSDYKNDKDDPTGNIIKEKSVVNKYGGKIHFTNEIVYSSSKLINQFIPTHSGELKNWVNLIKEKYGLEEVLRWLEKISRLKVAVIGETIIDTYTECVALGKSSKDPVLCFNKGPSVSYAGGILAIGSHCYGLGAKVKVFTAFNYLDKDNLALKGVPKNGLDIRSINLAPHPTIVKQRLVDSRTSARVLELYEMEDTPISENLESDFIKKISKEINKVDVVIIADYGHGLLTERIIDYVSSSDKFLAVNVQANAGNQGFNSISRYSRADFISLNGSEAQLETRRRHVKIDSYIANLKVKMKSKQILVTKGASGISIYADHGKLIQSPALAPFVKDRVGAGDAVFSITSLLSFVGAPEEIIGFIGNVTGAWAVTFIGNEKKLEKGTLVKHITALLK